MPLVLVVTAADSVTCFCCCFVVVVLAAAVLPLLLLLSLLLLLLVLPFLFLLLLLLLFSVVAVVVVSGFGLASVSVRSVLSVQKAPLCPVCASTLSIYTKTSTGGLHRRKNLPHQALPRLANLCFSPVRCQRRRLPLQDHWCVRGTRDLSPVDHGRLVFGRGRRPGRRATVLHVLYHHRYTDPKPRSGLGNVQTELCRSRGDDGGNTQGLRVGGCRSEGGAASVGGSGSGGGGNAPRTRSAGVDIGRLGSRGGTGS